MSLDAVWNAFTETGDPIYYMLYKSMQKQEARPKKEENDGTQGRLPRAED